MFTETSEGVVASITVVPRASRTEIVGPHGDTLKIRLQAPPVDGKANQALCRFLADVVEIARRDVELVSGTSSRQKRVLLRGVSMATAKGTLLHDSN